MWETQYQHPMPTETQFRKYWHCSVPRSGVPFKIKKASSRRTKLSIGNFIPHQSKWFLQFIILFLKNKLDLHNGMSVSWSYPWHLVHFWSGFCHCPKIVQVYFFLLRLYIIVVLQSFLLSSQQCLGHRQSFIYWEPRRNKALHFYSRINK